MKCAAVTFAIALAISALLRPAQADPATHDGLTRLAGTLGAVHYLHTLCRPGDGQVWRNRMLEMLATGGMTQQRKDQLIAAFNAGYSRQQTAHRACTPAAANLGNTYARHGAEDARALARRLDR